MTWLATSLMQPSSFIRNSALGYSHEAQLLTYLRFADRPLGLLINFNVTRLKDGIRRLVLTERDRQP